ncbi:bifunctional folylpolyglutamate synthase/dihydrofolate synthase [Dissulfurirhabdus thermomarina]|uniref:tetrahydrofolate synthase n=1 Tax=Dissulfurirhabdus thermomarina TaxID=1765737 RepID=A0A6N9TT63_DISTH|nr:folylpolyglutamate synthase/dihydrofolate synthase family protein [Dissulfurirhabdus thermomarina]NDY42934.1 bifunctional folylpolyglutamate synthase/dihydrofolate synthase [Dissulfurirhabdus thermomarina]NMX23212.1 bifunctional folylpolyglutamate synthase/dihydrofolate synthase [Dissulfurirhabdus thermomarina]
MAARGTRGPDLAAALAYLDRFQFHGFRLGLERMEAVLDALGHPERAVPVVHVAGTNGKGSAAALITAILSAAGLRVGLYTSPHLHCLAERFRIGGRPIPEPELAERIHRIRRLVEAGCELSYFEATTAIAFDWFRDAAVDLAVVETGLGGRLDATNVVVPRVSVITGVGLDHRSYLGRTLAAIAREKAGIVKPGVPVVSGVRRAAARRVVHGRCRELAAPLSEPGRDFTVRRWSDLGFHYRGALWRLRRISLALRGAHQVRNAGLAVRACEILAAQGVPVTGAHVRAGCRRVSWPGRLEVLAGPIRVLLDGAHNPDGVRALRAALDAGREWPPPERRVLLWGCSDEGGDKDYAGMLALVAGAAGRVVVTEPPGPRRPVRVADWRGVSLPPGARLEVDWRRALDTAREELGPGDLLCVAGSLYLVGAVRSALVREGFRPSSRCGAGPERASVS